MTEPQTTKRKKTGGAVYDIHTKGSNILLRILHGGQWRSVEITTKEANHIATILVAHVRLLEELP